MKRKTSVVLTILLLIGCLFSVMGCGEQKEQSNAVSKLDQILENGTIRVGVSLGGAPVAFRNDSGDPVGYDVDWATKLAETLGVELELVDVDAETRVAAITGDRVDVLFANVTANLERAKSIAFSIPYLKTGVKLLVRADVPYESLEEMNDPSIRLAVCRGSTGEALAMKYAPNATFVYVSVFTDQLLQLEQGKADAALEDSTMVDYAAAQSDGKLEARGPHYTSDPICVGMPYDAKLNRWMDQFISWSITQGFYEESYMKWWGIEPVELTAPW